MAAVIVSLAGLGLMAALTVVVVIARRRSASRAAAGPAPAAPTGPVAAMPPRLAPPVAPIRPPSHPRAPQPPARRPHPAGPLPGAGPVPGPVPGAGGLGGVGGVGGVSSPLTALSAVEKRGRLAQVESVSFVEAGAVAPEVAAAGGMPAPAVGDPTLVAEAVKDHLGVRIVRLRTTCQVLYVERVDGGTLIDLVTLDDCRVGSHAVPAGTALALGFGPAPAGADCQDLDAVMGYWEAIGALVELEVVESGRVAHYRFACREDGLALLVQSERA